jgi:hypothetical protein
MKRWIAVGLAATLALGTLAPRARAQVHVERRGAENPMVEVFRSTVYGGLAGLVVGAGIALVDDSEGTDPLKWGFVTGTFVGLGYGFYWVSRRPQPQALLEVAGGKLRVCAAPTLELGASPRVHLVAVRF